MGAVDKILKDYQDADDALRLDEFLENRDLRDEFTRIDAEEDVFRAPPYSSADAGETGGVIRFRKPLR